jgi:hypothetical protein
MKNLHEFRRPYFGILHFRHVLKGRLVLHLNNTDVELLSEKYMENIPLASRSYRSEVRASCRVLRARCRNIFLDRFPMRYIAPQNRLDQLAPYRNASFKTRPLISLPYESGDAINEPVGTQDCTTWTTHKVLVRW